MEIALGSIIVIFNVTLFELFAMLGLIALTVGTFIFMKRMRKDRTLKLGNYRTLQEVHGIETVASPIVLIVKSLTVISLFLVATGSIQMVTAEPVSDTDFVVAIDNSQTMNIPDYPPNRLGFATSQTVNWLERLPDNTEISAIAFGGGVRPLSTPGDDELALQQVENLEISSGAGKATGEAIIQGTNILTETENKGRIIVVTDGETTTGRNMTEAVTHAEENNVTVDIIGITETDSTEELFNELQQTLEETGFESEEVSAPEINSEQKQSYAEATGGNYYEISDQQFMDETMEQIVMEEDQVELNSSFYILLALSLLIILEMLLYSKYGAI